MPAIFGTTIAGAIAEFAFLPVYIITLAAAVAGAIMTYRYFISKKSPLTQAQRMA
jgi:hypothetical protein